MANKKNTLQVVVGSILILLLIGVTVLLISEKRANNELVQEFNLEKEDLENQYTDFAKQYDELKLTVSNDSLSVLLEQEQLKTQRLLEELRTVKSTNATEIRRLKKELATLRKVMIGYINQIDSLSRLTTHQKEVIADVTRKYNVASQQISSLAEEKKNLNKKVTLAAQLDVLKSAINRCNEHQHLCRQQAGQESQKGKRRRQAENQLHNRQEHNCRNRRTHPLRPYHQTGQRRIEQKRFQYISL